MRASHVRLLRQKKQRRGAAAVELAVLLPVLAFWAMATVDYARLAYAQVAPSKLRTQWRALRILRKGRLCPSFRMDELGYGRSG